MSGDTAAPPPERFNLTRYCLGNKEAEHTALIVVHDVEAEAECWSYGRLEDIVLRMAEGLRRLGLDPGDRLLIRMGNSAAYALVFFAANAAGLVPVPASPMLSPEEVGFLVGDARPRAMATDGTLSLPDVDDILVLGPDALAGLRESPRGDYADTGREDPAFLIYTSGTLGMPKGVLHAQRTVWGRRPMYQGWYGYRPGDIVLHTGAFNWSYTLGSGLFDPWANGLTAVVHTGRKDIAVWPRLITRFGPTIMAAVPTLYRQLLKYCDLSPDALAPLRHGLTAGEALPPALFEAFGARTGLTLYEALGMSEISTYISSSPTVPPKAGSPGRPQQGRTVAILPIAGGSDALAPGETGLLAVHRSDPGLMLGYWNRLEESRLTYRGDWFIGGDVARCDEDGYIWFEGRNDDLMNAFGYRVSPLEVEAALGIHPAVGEIAVGEVAVREDVSVIAAFVVPRQGAIIDGKALIDFGARRLADYKLPRAVYVVGDLPRSSNGKVRRKALQALAREAARA